MSDLFSTPTDTSSLRDAVVLVTGGASGLGRATCFALAEAGATVVVADLSADAGEAVAADVGGAFVRCDVSSMEDNEAMVAFTLERYGRLDHAYLNAGVSTGCGVADDFSLEKYRRAMGANLDGVVFGAHVVLGALRSAGTGGSIVATASLAGLVGMPLDPIYTANKHAVVGLARALGPAYTDEGIRFNAVCPGFAESNIIADTRESLIEAGFEIIPAESVAATVVRLMAGDMTGECWYVQPRREPGPFKFRGVPGPGDRADD
jgi:NAD(P)-dependent dehydrogenase (short-subunit alcohol dehydrogenase family)